MSKLFKKFVKNSLYQFVKTTDMGKGYLIDHYIGKGVEPFRIRTVHKQLFGVRFLIFPVKVWFKTQIDTMDVPREAARTLEKLELASGRIKTINRDYPLADAMAESLFTPIAVNGDFLIKEVFYGKVYENGDVKIIKVDYLETKELPVVDTKSIVVPKDVVEFMIMTDKAVTEAEEHIEEEI